jgi:linoleoyl-CoA desaturase
MVKAIISPTNSFKTPDFTAHPGGQTNLELARKSTRGDLLFLSYHIGLDLDGKIAKQAAGRSVEMPKRGPMFEEVHQAVLRVKAAHPEQHWVHVGFSLFVTIAVILCVVKLLWSPALWSSTLLAVGMSSYFLAIFHTRHHKGGVQYGISWLDALTSPLYDFIEGVWGIYPPVWRDHHQGSHHLFTNVVDDYDVESPFPVFRLHPDQPKKWFHKYQSIYAPFVFSFTTFSYPFFNIIYGCPRGYTVAWLLINGVIPGWAHGWAGILNVAYMYAITGVVLSYSFQVSHNHTKMGDRAAGMHSVDEWISRQIEQSVSWGGYLSTVVMGGLNYQIEHHVAPALDTPYYYFLRPELQRICKKYNVNYTFEPTAFHAVSQYHHFLSTMG